MQASNRLRVKELRIRLHEILDHGVVGDQTGRIVGQCIVLLIVINLAAVTLESVPDLALRYGPWFEGIEVLSLVVFTIEYGLRVWVAADFPQHRHLKPQKARWKFITSGLGIIDLLAVLPFWLALVLPVDLRVLLVLRVIRFLKLARYSAGMNSLLEAIYAERRALFGCFVMLIGATRRTRRSATTTAVTRASLLALDAHDLRALMDREPRVAERIREVVRHRIGRDVVTPQGDVISEELEVVEEQSGVAQ